MTHEFLGKALEVWRLNSPGITVDCIEMDSISQERALLEGRISVGILVPSDRPVLELLHVRVLIKIPGEPGAAEVPSSCQQAGDSFIAPERGTFYRAKSYVPELRRLAFESLPSRGFQAANRQGSGRRRERARLCSSGVWGGDGQRAAAKDTRQGCGFPQSDARGQSVGTCGRRLEAGGDIRSSGFSIRRRVGSSLCRRKRGIAPQANNRLN
jgi:hypothetical protein